MKGEKKTISSPGYRRFLGKHAVIVLIKVDRGRQSLEVLENIVGEMKNKLVKRKAALCLDLVIQVLLLQPRESAMRGIVINFDRKENIFFRSWRVD